jgi:methylthioribose-1-phosphate isomerase
MNNPFFELDILKLDDTKNALIILDQTQLPTRQVFIELKTIEEIYSAIRELKVRGAPAIGIAAAFGIYLSIKNSDSKTFDSFYQEFKHNKIYLSSARPTAVNLSWALNRMESIVLKNSHKSIKKLILALKEEAERIKEEDITTCSLIGEYGKVLIKEGMGILTHCNAGHLAVGKYGTALSPIYFAHQEKKKFRVYADETRPLLQGSRLTVYELQQSGIDVTLICDNMASIVMKNGWIDLVLTGCDRVAANGDTANKIGTSGVAILAKYYNIPFYICGPTSSFDMNCRTGNDIIIEERKGTEITDLWYSKRMAPKECKTYNPAFDVTDHNLISGFITEKGIIHPPFKL